MRGERVMVEAGPTAYFSVFVLFAVGARSPMGLPEQAYGLLLAGLAGGSLIGSLAAGRLERTLGPRRLLLGTMAIFSLLLATPVLTSDLLPIAAMLIAVGFLAAAANIVSVSSRQRIVPDALLGRVNSAYRLLGSGAQPLGGLLGGLLAQTLGLRTLSPPWPPPSSQPSSPCKPPSPTPPSEATTTMTPPPIHPEPTASRRSRTGPGTRAWTKSSTPRRATGGVRP